jgi:branched-subunit amino acid ABC-type transport system permease component
MNLLFDIVLTSGTLLLVAIGLQLILGLMNIVNLAHTGFMAVSVYVVVSLTERGWGFWPAVAAALVASAVVGAIVEWFVLRRLYDSKIDDTILATWAVSLCVVHALTLVYGRSTLSVQMPIDGGVEIMGNVLPAYRVALVTLVAAIVAVLAALVRFTRVGLIVRMVMSNEGLARGLGVDTGRVRRNTFVAGAAFAGLAGALLGPTQAITPHYGAIWLPPTMLVVLMAGPSLGGLLTASAILGTAQAVLSALTNPVLAGALTILVAVVVLRVKPAGLAWSRA